MDTFNPMVDLPLGFGMDLAQNVDAMKYFASLSPDEQRAVIDQTHNIASHDEMKTFVRSLTGQHDL